MGEIGHCKGSEVGENKSIKMIDVKKIKIN